jgi:nucleoside-diphosphate-sugar epimerase
MGSALKGTSKPILITGGAALIAPGRVVTEADVPGPDFALPRRSEFAARELAAGGVRAAIVRIGLAHGPGDRGFLPFLVNLARQTGVSAYLGDGRNRWPGVHRDDAARLFGLILEEGVTKPVYHAVAEEGIPFRNIAEEIGRGLGLPVEARDPSHFDWFAGFAGIDMPQSGTRTRELTKWRPREIELLPDLHLSRYFH